MGYRRQRTAAFLLAALGPAGLARPALAQYRAPAPVPQTQVTGAPEQAGTGPQAADANQLPGQGAALLGSGWDKEFVLDGAWEKNVGFTAPSGPSDAFGDLRATLSHWRRGTRSDVRLTAEGAGFLYAKLTSFNRADALVRLDTNWRMSPRTTLALAAGANRAHSDTQGNLIAQGIVLPPVRTDAGQVGVTLTRQLGTRTSVVVDGAWQRMTFGSTVYTDTTDWTGGLGLSRALSPRVSLVAQARFRQSDTKASQRRVPAFTANLRSRLATHLFLTLGGGVNRESVVLLNGGSYPPPRLGFTGSVSLGGNIRRATLNATYNHGIVPTPGLIFNELVDALGLGATVPMGRSYELVADGAMALRRLDTTQRQQRYRYADTFVGLARTIGFYTKVVLGYRYRFRDDTGRARNDRASLSFVWTPGLRAVPSAAGGPQR